jgi:hypothetical protein
MRAFGSVSAVAAMVVIVGVNEARAQSATQIVTFRVNPISEIAVSGSPAPIAVDAPRGSATSSATMGGTSYAITTNEGNQKISVALDRMMPNGVSLAVALGAPEGGASTGSVAIGTRATDVVTHIPEGAARGLPIVYTLSASSAARRGASGTRIVTYTISAGL